MPKKGGKKHNKNKNKGAGGAKVPDVKNVISPGHKEEDKLLCGEGSAAEATAAEEVTPATATGSAETAPVVETAPKTEEVVSQDTTETPSAAAVPEEEAKQLPAREQGVVSTDKTKRRGDERTEALAAAAPTDSKKQVEKEVAKETKIAEPVPERPVTSERADLVADTHGKEEPAAPAATGVSEAIPDVPKDRAPGETAGVVTAGVAGTALGRKTEEDRAQPAGLEKKETPKDAPAKLPAERLPDSVEVATAAPPVAPHIKRAHEVPAFVTQERDQPSKKPRVNEPTEAQPNLAIPGRFPSPSVAGSTASGTDSAVADAQNISKGETVAEKPETVGTVTAGTSIQPTGPKGPTEAAIAAPAAKPGAKTVDETSTAAAVSAEPPAGEISAQKEPVLPATSQKVDTTAKPANQAAAAVETRPTAEQQQKQQVAATKAAEPTPAQKEAKKGGFFTWIKRKFKGEKSNTA
ncbi:hypothetical protein TSTA_083480 [Talaromyces stipitatus ATCC 10500]|uniref:Uncharacterized protein n=1 Tax=Talaromyces stipitatus (strain ATCC 10500 / CBS 375.48 / QM 6759 / NRRL 1006) TaxID=441959 RepID=B8LZ72_TALSN|nr:uncharacterized protein TSTA_083480 [Talaromyces stipitatus ATCC 10500]EED21116.1 hypothetical protein TSTA_083480 [Talaromyces stipitatus ATCC 10500]